MTKRLPFEPPAAEQPTKTETAATIAGGVALLAVSAIVEPIADALRITGLIVDAPDPPFDQHAQQAALEACGAASTEPPVTDELGHVQCAQCSQFVPYNSMSLNEDGCFCARCAARLTDSAVAEIPDETYKL